MLFHEHGELLCVLLRSPDSQGEGLDTPEHEVGLVGILDRAHGHVDRPNPLEQLGGARHYHAGHNVCVPVEELRHAVHHDVGAVFEGPLKHRAHEGVIYHEQRALPMRDLRALSNVGQLDGGVGRSLHIHDPGVRAHGLPDPLQVRRVHKCRLDSKSAELILEQQSGRAVKGVPGNNVVPCFQQRHASNRDCGHARRSCEPAAASLQGRHVRLQRLDSRVRDAGINVPVDSSREQIRAVVRVLERERRALVDGRHHRTGGRVGMLPCVDSGGPNAVGSSAVAFIHACSLTSNCFSGSLPAGWHVAASLSSTTGALPCATVR